MNRTRWLAFALLLLWAIDASHADAQASKSANITWKKIVLDKKFRSEGAGVADVNKDGKLDVIVGDCWYEAPKDPNGPWTRHILRNDRVFDLKVYSDSFCCFPGDFNGDGWTDVIVIPFPGNPCYWYENPGASSGKWQAHLLTTSACNETPIYVDLFKTGKKNLVMGWNPPKVEGDLKKGNFDDRGEMCYFVPGSDPTQPWQRISISGPSAKGKTIPGTRRFSHGLGHGDVNGDGRIDVLCADGWWEQPAKVGGTPWPFHAAKISEPCADMHTYDMTGAGKADIISTSAHNYGFWWSEQKDGGAFVRRALFLSPFELAKLPATLTLNAEEKALFEAINKVQVNHYGRAPYGAVPALCQAAREAAQTSGDFKISYAGKVLAIQRKTFAAPAKAELKKGELTPLQKFVQSLWPDFDKDGRLARPGLDIGVGAVKLANGEVQYTLVIGDRGLFSLPSQTHALRLVDIDGDGLKDFVTGRRWWAHGPRGDAGPNDPAYLYWFQARRGKDGLVSFTPHRIDDASGIGTSFAIADINGDGLPDIAVANKKGVHVFLQQR